MANDVFANGREISCKKADGKSICAFPDVCFTPPQTPATPPGVPIPYPNTAFAKDTTKGSKSVKISGKEVMLKNKSYFKKSTGDEAGRAPKKGIVTSKITGKVYFTSWSPNVKFEGKNVVRHLDLTTHNHSSTNPTNTCPWSYVDSGAISAKSDDCKRKKDDIEETCKDSKLVKTDVGKKETYKTHKAKLEGKTRKSKKLANKMTIRECDDECKNAQKCILVRYDEQDTACCSPENTGHHLLPNSLLQGKRKVNSTNVTGAEDYTEEGGMCVCVNYSAAEGKHKELHDYTKEQFTNILESGKKLTYERAKEIVVEAHAESFPQCDKTCIKNQLDESLPKGEVDIHQKDGITRRKNFGKGNKK